MSIQEAYVHGISTRWSTSLVQAMGMSGISKSQVSRLCVEIDEKVQTFLNRPLEARRPYLSARRHLLNGSVSPAVSSRRRDHRGRA